MAEDNPAGWPTPTPPFSARVLDRVEVLRYLSRAGNAQGFEEVYDDLVLLVGQMAWLEAQAAYAGVPLPRQADGSLYG